jgi:SAM-dependent methyltransferase
LASISPSRRSSGLGRASPDGHFIRADILESNFDDGAFDAVVALFVLTHIPTAELPGLLHRISDWLRPEGWFLATFSSAGAHDELDDWLGVPMFFSGLDPSKNEELLKAAGMRVVESQVEPMQEPEGEVRFHWLLAQKLTDGSGPSSTAPNAGFNDRTCRRTPL